jgi:signal transduction histidine kinase
MVQSSEHLTQEQFHEHVKKLELSRHFPAVEFINYAVYVPQEGREAFVKGLRTRAQQFMGAKAQQLNISPPGVRPNYLAIAFIEPDTQRPDLYGYDLLSNPYFGTQLLREREERAVGVSGTPIAALSTPNNAYLGMRMPVFSTGVPLATPQQRRAAYVGSLGIAFNLPNLLKGVMDEIPVSGVRLTVYDMGPGIDKNGHPVVGRPLTLFDTRGRVGNPAPPLDTGDNVFTVSLPLDFNSRPWKLTYSVPKAALYTTFDIHYPKLMMAFGFIASMLLYALLHTLTSSRRAALELAQEMTSELRESQNKLQLSHQKLRRLADHAYQIKELERKRIAREIHDDLGQNLLALRIESEMLASRTRGTHSRLHTRARATLQQIDTIIKSVRQIINDLRPTVLDLGLSAAVEWQVEQFRRRTGIECEVHDEHGEISLPDHCATAFFRILQESLTNVVRHANATKVVVELRLNAGWLSMTVRDNGCGLPPGGRNKFGSFGLVGIEERIVILGGICTVFSEPGGGTTVMVSAPVLDAPEHLLQEDQAHSAGSAII